MRKYLLYVGIAVATGLAACSKTDTPSVEQVGETVCFTASVAGKQDHWGSKSRGTAIDGTNISQFSAFCFNTGRALWVDAQATATPNKMYNVRVTRNGNEWAYDSLIKWEGGDGSYFTFFGYSPCATGIYNDPDNVLGNNLEQLSTASDTGIPSLKYTTLDYIPSQVDLLFATPVYNTYPVAKVQMKFAHALSQIRFKAWSSQDFVRVKSIQIFQLIDGGEFHIDGTLISAASTYKDFILNEINQVISTDETKMTDLTDGGKSFLVMPQNLTSRPDAKIVITYEVKGEEKTSTPYPIAMEWVGGKSYIYTIKLGGAQTEEMTVTGVTITDWVVDGSEDLETGNGTTDPI